MIHLYCVVDCIVESALGGGLRRGLRNARNLHPHGFQSHILTLENVTSPDFAKTWSVQIQHVAQPAGLSQAAKRENLFQAAFEAATLAPPRQRLLVSGGTNISRNTLRTLRQARRAGVPTLYDTSMFPDSPPSSLLQRWKLWLAQHLFLTQHARVFCQTQALRRHYQKKLLVPASKIEVSPNGVDCQRFRPATPAERSLARQSWGVPDHAPLVITVGNVIPRKGTDVILHAWQQIVQQHPEAHLVIAGTLGQRATFAKTPVNLDGYAAQVQDLAAALPHPERVHFIGHLEEVEHLHRAADLFLFASAQEGLPNVILEAMASGLPCIMSQYPGFPLSGEEFGHDRTHFISATREPESLATAACHLLSCSEARAQMGMEAREWMLKTQDLTMLTLQMAGKLRQLAAHSA